MQNRLFVACKRYIYKTSFGSVHHTQTHMVKIMKAKEWIKCSPNNLLRDIYVFIQKKKKENYQRIPLVSNVKDTSWP